MDNHDKIELRSEKVRNIINAKPAWVVRYGILMLYIAAIGVLAMLYFCGIGRI